MKLQTILTASIISILAIPMAVMADSIEKDENSGISEGTACEPVDGYPCCKKSSPKIYDIDHSGAWGVENHEWCFIKVLQPFTEVKIELFCWLNRMADSWGEPRNPEAYYQFTLVGSNTSDFFENYEIEGIMINGHRISNDKIYLQKHDPEVFRIDSKYYVEGTNKIKFAIKNKITNASYKLELSGNLIKAS